MQYISLSNVSDNIYDIKNNRTQGRWKIGYFKGRKMRGRFPGKYQEKRSAYDGKNYKQNADRSVLSVRGAGICGNVYNTYNAQSQKNFLRYPKTP